MFKFHRAQPPIKAPISKPQTIKQEAPKKVAVPNPQAHKPEIKPKVEAVKQAVVEAAEIEDEEAKNIDGWAKKVVNE